MSNLFNHQNENLPHRQGLKQCLDALPQIIWCANQLGEITFLNQKWQEHIYQNDTITLPEEKFFQATHPEDRERVKQKWQTEIRSQSPYKVKFRLRNSNGDYKLFVACAEPLKGENGAVIEWVGTLEPITKTQEALRKSEERWQLAVEGAGDGIFDWNIITGEAFMSPNLKGVLGYRDQEIPNTYEGWHNLVHPDDFEQVLENLEAHLNHQASQYVAEYRLRCQDGSYKWISAKGLAKWDETGKPIRMVGSHQDITERKEAEAEIIRLNQELEAKIARRTSQLEAANQIKDESVNRAEKAQAESKIYQDIVENIPIGFFVWRLKDFDDLSSFQLVTVNPAASQLLEVPLQDEIGSMMGDCFPKLLTPGNAAIVTAYIDVIREGKAKILDDVIYSNKTGNKSVFALKAFPLPNHCVGVAFDNVTRRKRAEAALAASEQKHRSVVNSVKEVIFQTNQEGCWTFLNQAWNEITGFSITKSLGIPFINYIYAEEEQQECGELFQDLLAKKREFFQYAFRCQTKTGKFRWLEMEAQLYRNSEGEVLGTSGTLNDITERQQNEAILQAKADELAQINTILLATTAQLEKRNQELDQFAYVTSHDLKAPLRAIANLSQWIEEDLEEFLTEDTKHQMDLLRGRVHRMEALINGLLQYSRVGRIQGRKERVVVGEILEEVIDFLAPPPEFQITITSEMPTLQTERLPLQQVFTNLIGNAIKHHPSDQGKVQISVTDQGKFYEFVVEDDGSGIAPQYHDKVFVIFQTLEARDKTENTGIGLSIVKKAVEAQGGTIKVESQLGEGTIFRFTWPK